MTVFSFGDYKDFLKNLIEANSGIRGYQTKLAEAAGCQRAYMSQVVNGNAHLTFDQAAGLCEFWQMRETETEYFLELLQLARAGTPALRTHVRRRLADLKRRHSELSREFKSTGRLSEQQQSVYYSNWAYAAVHVLVSIPDFQREAAIAERFRLPVNQVRTILADLEKMKLVVRSREGRWSPSERNLFLPMQSHMIYMLHSNWRNQALADLQKGSPTSLHYSTLHAASRRDIERLREMIVDFIKETKAVVEPSPEEDMVCLNMDFFVV